MIFTVSYINNLYKISILFIYFIHQINILICNLGDPDYKMKCIGYWKENLKSYLITYDELDPSSKYRCWVYQRADLNRILMSQSGAPFCSLAQDVTSSNYTEGAVVALDMMVKYSPFTNIK